MGGGFASKRIFLHLYCGALKGFTEHLEMGPMKQDEDGYVLACFLYTGCWPE